MAGSVNKVILIGNLGADPEIRRTQDGRPVANLRLATSESWRDKATGERKEKTEWHRVVIFNENLCRVAEQYLKKGSKVFIEGQLQTRKWQDQSGQDRYSTEVVLQGFRGELTLLDRAGGAGGGDFAADDNGGEFGSPGPTRKVAAAGAGGRGARADMDDEIPLTSPRAGAQRRKSAAGKGRAGSLKTSGRGSRIVCHRPSPDIPPPRAFP